jgi:hypothetical protein
MDGAVFVARDEERGAESVVREGVAILREECRRRDHEWELAEQESLLGFEPLDVCIDACIELDDFAPHRGLATGERVGESTLTARRAQNGSWCVHAQLVHPSLHPCKSPSLTPCSAASGLLSKARNRGRGGDGSFKRNGGTRGLYYDDRALFSADALRCIPARDFERLSTDSASGDNDLLVVEGRH